MVDCSKVTQVDTLGAAVIRAALDAHLVDPRRRATIIEPNASDIWPFVSDALGRLPSRAEWAGARSPAARGTDVLITAEPIPADQVQLLVRTIGTFAAALGHGPRPGRLLREAARVFLDNVAAHAPNAPTPPVVCSAFEPVSRDLQLVCVNLMPSDELVAADTSDLKRMVGDPGETFRSLHWLARRRRADLDFSLTIFTGAVRARHRVGGAWTFTALERAVPGFIAGIEIHR